VTIKPGLQVANPKEHPARLARWSMIGNGSDILTESLPLGVGGGDFDHAASLAAALVVRNV
jgi:hypothetical protein